MEYYAKTYKDQTGQSLPGISVEQHCITAGLVCKEILSYLPSHIKNKFFKGDDIAFIIAAHDIGKISPGFQDLILGKDTYDNLKDKYQMRHENVSCEHLKGYLKSKYGLGYKKVAEIPRRHHERQDNDDRMKVASIQIGDSHWESSRNDLCDKLANIFLINPENLIDIKDPLMLDLYQGLLCVSDWIASDSEYFPPNEEMTQRKIEKRIKKALKDYGLTPLAIDNKSFEDRFGFKTLTPLQEKVLEVVDGPGIYFIEDLTGGGKTEAALYPALECIADGELSGLYFALPTQVTSNMVFNRISSYFKYDEDINSRDLRLIHGNSVLERTYGNTANSMDSGFNGNKRGLISPIGVGTIDQSCAAVIPRIKHFFLRVWGLINKALILDEIHSYDSYTTGIIQKLVQDAYSLDCAVIILSATLTKKQKESFLPKGSQCKSDAFPLLTSYKEDEGLREYPIPYTDSQRDYYISLAESYDLNDIAIKVLNGLMVLWIENTVKSSQRVYDEFLKILPEDKVGLLNSAFTVGDRTLNEDKWISVFGKEGQGSRTGCVLVSTQVCEQSVDIDADFLVTGICPTDLLIQRLGRLWRHPINNPNRKVSRSECVILSPDLSSYKNDEPKHFLYSVLKDPGYVYSVYIIFKTYELLKNKGKVTLPMQARELLEDTYKNENIIRNYPAISYWFRQDELDRKTKEELSKRAKKGQWESTSLVEDPEDSLIDQQSILGARLIHGVEEVILLKHINETNSTGVTIYDDLIDMFKASPEKLKATIKIRTDRTEYPIRKIEHNRGYSTSYLIVDNSVILNHTAKPSDYRYTKIKGFYKK